jgi:hypothetical protein
MVVSQVNQTTDMAKDQARSLVPDIDARFTATTALYDGLLSRLNSMAISGQISKDRCVEVMTPVICEIIENYLSLDLVSQAKAQFKEQTGMEHPLSKPNMDLKTYTPIKAGIPVNLFDDLVNTVIVSLRSFFRGGGLKQFVQAFFDLLDVNNDGAMSKEEFTNLGDATRLLFQVRSPPARTRTRELDPPFCAAAHSRTGARGAGVAGPRAQGEAHLCGQGVPQPHGRRR